MREIPRPSRLNINGTNEQKINQLITYLENLSTVLQSNLNMTPENGNTEKNVFISNISEKGGNLVITKSNNSVQTLVQKELREDMSKNIALVENKLPVIEKGTLNLTEVSSNYETKTITFEKPFNKKPNVMVYQTAYPANRYVAIIDVTKTDFTIRYNYTYGGSASIGIGWFAIGN